MAPGDTQSNPEGHTPDLQPTQTPETKVGVEVSPETKTEQSVEHETQPESSAEQEGTTASDQQEQLMDTQQSASAASSASVAEPDRLEKEIEVILQEDLTDMFLAMRPEDQQKFKQKGEETVGQIRQLLTSTKINAKKIFTLIREWLKVIPGVNRYFLEQEAKIKTDKILIVNEEEENKTNDMIA